jgi:phage gp16-like protein
MKVSASIRTRELATIHVAKKQLGLDDGTYRDMLFTLTRKRSAGDLDHAERQRVIEHMRKRGFTRPVAAPAPRSAGRKPEVPADRQALVNKVEALLGARPWEYARAMAKRMFKVDQLEWASAEQLRSLVAALEYDKRRRAGKA